MCGRYALGIRAALVRRHLEELGMPVDEAPEDDEVRQTHNFAPGTTGLVYRAQHGDNEIGHAPDDSHGGEEVHGNGESNDSEKPLTSRSKKSQDTSHALQAMRWGLIPFWTKRKPDYGSMMKTINCRDDSLIENRGMWTPMKKKKRCIVVCQGFYEWLKKSGGQKVPHFTKRKDGQLMLLAGLYDSVIYEGSAEPPLYTYTIITTSSNAQLNFLHDRMPVILDPKTKEFEKWLDPSISEWSEDMQSILKPYEGELECYPVDQAVGKVGNDSASFIVPIDSKENKNNIANFFGNAASKSKGTKANAASRKKGEETKIKTDPEENRATKKEDDSTENNAPKPIPKKDEPVEAGIKREHSIDSADEEPKAKTARTNTKPEPKRESPRKSSPVGGRKMRSATSNGTVQKEPAKKDGTQRITNFFKK